MRRECKDCTFFKNNLCIKNSKNGYFNCKKYKSISLEDLRKEMMILLVSKEDNDRLNYIIKKISDINGGTY